MRKRLLLFGSLATLVVLVALWLLWPRTAITRENGHRIQVGMTLAEVETMLGGAARDDATGPVEIEANGIVILEPVSDLDLDGGRHGWKSDHVLVEVVFDRNSHVAEVSVIPVRRTNENPLDMLRRWFRL
jgi:hypothetical protein